MAMDSQASRIFPKKRTTNFREDETKLLIELWGSPQIQSKLYLTHRKAPVMRLLAASMQERGFYRTSDEIKTRIRNLKCLYHRIKRSTQCGIGLGTVDPDWPHFKAMDEILTRRCAKNESVNGMLEGPKCEDIKQEVDDIDINDDMDSFTTNSFGGSDCEDGPSLDITNFPGVSKDSNDETARRSEDFRLGNQENSVCNKENQDPNRNVTQKMVPVLCPNMQDIDSTLRELVNVQKETLEVEKRRLELEKQKVDFERCIGTQILDLLPAFGGMLRNLGNKNDDKDEEKL